MVKHLPAEAGDQASVPGSGRAWGRKWPLTPVFLPGKFHGQRSLDRLRTMGLQSQIVSLGHLTFLSARSFLVQVKFFLIYFTMLKKMHSVNVGKFNVNVINSNPVCSF